MQQTDIQALIASAQQAQRAGRGADAERLFRQVLARGEHPLALNALGMRALNGGDTSAAAALFRRAIAADPAAPELHINLAKALRTAGDDAGEQAALEGALAIDQRHFMALVRLAELFERTGDSGRAADRWAGVVAIGVMIDERTPALDAILERAREAVARHQAGFAAAIDAELAPRRAGLDAGERRRFDASIDHLLGRRAIYANHCHGLYVPFLPADEFFDRSHFPWMDEIEANTDVIRGELEALLAAGAQGFSPYVAMASGTPENKWSPLDHKPDWSALHLWRHGRRDEAVCARCPETAAAVEALPLADMAGRAPSVFFSILKPGTHLPAHTGVTNARAIVHLPLIVPEGCSFRVGGETREWRTGEAWAFDDTIEHEAWNRSDQLRAVLIFDVWNPHLTATERDLLRDFFPIADRNGYDLRQAPGD